MYASFSARRKEAISTVTAASLNLSNRESTRQILKLEQERETAEGAPVFHDVRAPTIELLRLEDDVLMACSFMF